MKTVNTMNAIRTAKGLSILGVAALFCGVVSQSTAFADGRHDERHDVRYITPVVRVIPTVQISLGLSETRMPIVVTTAVPVVVVQPAPIVVCSDYPVRDHVIIRGNDRDNGRDHDRGHDRH
jgi:hypothetical protein